MDLEATDTIDIVDFVDLAQINPIYFHRPYYLEPQKGGAAAYNLLRRVLADSNKAGISKVIIRTRQHLAAVKANGNLLVLELMRFADELVPPGAIRVSAEKPLGQREIGMAKTLVNQMTETWDPERDTDDYRSAVMKLFDGKVKKRGGKATGCGALDTLPNARPTSSISPPSSGEKPALAAASGPKTKPAKKPKGRKKPP